MLWFSPSISTGTNVVVRHRGVELTVWLFARSSWFAATGGGIRPWTSEARTDLPSAPIPQYPQQRLAPLLNEAPHNMFAP